MWFIEVEVVLDLRVFEVVRVVLRIGYCLFSFFFVVVSFFGFRVYLFSGDVRVFYF